MSSVRTVYVVIAGFGTTGATGAYMPRIGPTQPIAGTLRQLIARYPKTTSSRVDILDGPGKGGGMTLSLVYDDTEAMIQAIARSTVAPLTGPNNEDVYITEFVEADRATLIPLSSDCTGILSVDDYVWIGGNVIKVATVTSSGFTGIWGQLGTESTAIPYQGDGARVFLDLPDVVGRPIRVNEYDSGNTTLYRGRVTDVEMNAKGRPEITLRTASRMNDLFGSSDKRKFFVPRARDVSGILGAGAFLLHFTDSGRRMPALGVFRFFKGGAFGPIGDVNYLRLTAVDDDGETDGRWAVVEVARTVNNDEYEEFVIDLTNDYNVVQVGRGESAVPVELWGTVFEDDDPFTGRLEWCGVYTDTVQVSEIVLDLLQGRSDWPWTVSLGVADSEIDADSLVSELDFAISLAGGVRSTGISPTHVDAVNFILPRFDEDRSISEVIHEEFIEPLMCALAPARDGRIRAINFRNVILPDESLSQSDITSGDVGPVKRSTAGIVREIQYNREVGDGQYVDRIISSVASAISAAGRVLSFDVSALAGHLARGDGTPGPIDANARGVLASYERSVARTTFRTFEDVTLDVGDVAMISTPYLPGTDGVHGSQPIRFLVLEAGRESSGERTYGGALLGSDIGCLWGPEGLVDSYSSGTITFSNTGHGFDVGDYAILLDQYGTEKTGTPTEVTAVTSTTIDCALASSVSGDIVVLADYDETGHDNNWAWMGDNDARVGAANDGVKVWT